MTTLLMATADLPMDTGSWYVSATQARTGTKSFYRSATSSNNTLTFIFPEISVPVYWRTCFHQSRVTEYFGLLGRLNNTSGASILSITGEGTRALSIRQGGATGTVLHEIPNAVLTGVWQVIEIYCSTTTVTARFNGVEVYHSPEQSFNLAGLSYLVYSGCGFNASTMWDGFVDDIVVCTDKWPGLGGLHVFAPTGPGTVTDWSGSLPNLNTPAAASGTKHLFTHDNAPATAALVHRIGVGYTAKVNGQGYGSIKPLLNNDAGTEQALSVSSQDFQQYWPGMSVADFNASEIGVQSA